MAKKPNPKQTGPAAAHDASKELRDKKSTQEQKKVAVSDLSQAPFNKSKKKEK